METKKVQSFTDLIAWQEAHKMVLLVYTITREFPKEELFGLTSQLRRAVVSITSNIAEGFSRLSFKEKIQFYTISLGSLTEVENQLIVAKDIGYITKTIFQELHAHIMNTSKLLNGLIKKTKTFIYNS